jgi:hypothetical protein
MLGYPEAGFADAPRAQGCALHRPSRHVNVCAVPHFDHAWRYVGEAMTRVETTKETMFEVEVHRRIQWRRQQRDGRPFAVYPALTQRRPAGAFWPRPAPSRRRRTSPPPTNAALRKSMRYCRLVHSVAVPPPMCLTRARHASNVENEQLGCPAAVVPLTCAQNLAAFAEPSGKRTKPTERSIIRTTSGTVSFDIAASRWLIDFRYALFVNYQTARFHQAKHCAVVMPTPERTRQSASYFIARQLVATDRALSQVSAQTRSRFDFLGHSPDFTGRTDRTAGRRHVDDHSSLTQVWWGPSVLARPLGPCIADEYGGDFTAKSARTSSTPPHY